MPHPIWVMRALIIAVKCPIVFPLPPVVPCKLLMSLTRTHWCWLLHELIALLIVWVTSIVVPDVEKVNMFWPACGNWLLLRHESWLKTHLLVFKSAKWANSLCHTDRAMRVAVGRIALLNPLIVPPATLLRHVLCPLRIWLIWAWVNTTACGLRHVGPNALIKNYNPIFKCHILNSLHYCCKRYAC